MENTYKDEKEKILKIIYKEYGSILLDKKQLQSLLGYSQSTINRLMASNSIPYVKLNDYKLSQVKFVISDVVEMLFEHRIEAYKSHIKEDI